MDTVADLSYKSVLTLTKLKNFIILFVLAEIRFTLYMEWYCIGNIMYE